MFSSPQRRYPLDPNIKGNGALINEMANEKYFDRNPGMREVMAEHLDVDRLLANAYEMNDVESRLRQRGFDDINNLIDSGIFIDCPEKLLNLVARITFPDRMSQSRQHLDSRLFVAMLDRASRIQEIPGLVDVVAGRAELVDKAWGKKLLCELLERGFFEGRQDAVDTICENLHELREGRKTNLIFTSANGFAEGKARESELPLVRSIVDAGFTVRYSHAVPTGALEPAGLGR